MTGVEAFILLIASFVISYALTPSVKPPDPAAFDDFDFPVADEGTPQAVIWGDVWITDWMVIFVGKYRTEPIYSEGGKK